jgi:hypothetical protein
MSSGILGSDDLPWYGWMFVGLAIFVVCPVWCLSQISGLTGWKFGGRHIIWLEAIFVGIIVLATAFLMRVYPEMRWYESFGAIVVVALIRGGIWTMHQLFKSELDDD